MLSLPVRENEFGQRITRDTSVDEIHSLDAVLHAQPPRQLAVAATWTKSQQSKMPALFAALPQQLDKPKSGPYSAALLSECEIRLPANARPSKKKPEKTPKLSFMLKRLKAVLRLDGPGSGSSHKHARMSACLLAQCDRLACTSGRTHACRDRSFFWVRFLLGFNAFVAMKTLDSTKRS